MSLKSLWREHSDNILRQFKQLLVTTSLLIRSGKIPQTIPSRSDLKAAICAIVRDEAPYLLEWIAYHRVIGFDYFCIYDNDSTDGTTEILRGLERAEILKYIPWPSKPGISPQESAYENFLTSLDHAYPWVAFIDLDEFIVPKTRLGIKPFLNRCVRSRVAAVAMNWKIFGSSGENEKTDGLVMKRFMKCSLENFDVNNIFKTIARTDQMAGIMFGHSAIVKNGKYIYPDGTKVGKGCTVKGKHIDHKTFQLNHYFTKSRAEWEVKRKRGRADFPFGHPKHIRSDHMFTIHDRNETEDRSILKFSEKTKEEMESLRKSLDLSSIQ